MTIGTFVVSAILVVIVAAIIVNMVRSHRAGKHVGCDGCGACGCHSAAMDGHSCGCSHTESIIAHMNTDLENSNKK